MLNALRKKLGGELPAKPPAAMETKTPLPAPPAKLILETQRAFFIQVGAFSAEARANIAAKQVGGSSEANGKYWRVRAGPYPSEAAAKAALGPVVAKGYRDARITR